MTIFATTSIALAALIIGIYLGYHHATQKWELARYEMNRDYQYIIDHVSDHIEANAHRWGVHIVRNNEGHIVRFEMRCGTPTVLTRQWLEQREHRKRVH